MQDRPEPGTSFPEGVVSWLEGDRSPEVTAAVDAWRREAAGNEVALREFSLAWEASRAPEVPLDWDDLRARAAGSAPPAPAVVVNAAPPRRGAGTATDRASRTWWGAAAAPLRAAAILLLGVGLGLLGQQVWHAVTPEQVARVVVPAGSRSSLELPGGVMVQLSYATELSYTPSRDVREVHLNGEAFFSVPEGDRRNLLVHTEAGLVRDLGTEFNVRARSGTTSVVVTDGVVRLETQRGTVRLQAGEASSMAVGQAPAPATPANLELALDWMAGRLTFYDETLDRVAEELERRFGVPFEVAAPLRTRRITAVIPEESSAADAATVLCLSVQAQCSQEAGVWRITAGPR